jgi:hypothetical protein
MNPSSTGPESLPSVAIIGSFRRHYDEVLNALGEFVDQGLIVRSPHRSRILDPSQEFVRFELDDPDSSDVEIEYHALREILAADVVYVVCPEGYLGRTTCYELGWVLARDLPVFFSDVPKDLPIPIPAGSVESAHGLARAIIVNGHLPVVDPFDIPERVRALVTDLHHR